MPDQKITKTSKRVIFCIGLSYCNFKIQKNFIQQDYYNEVQSDNYDFQIVDSSCAGIVAGRKQYLYNITPG